MPDRAVSGGIQAGPRLDRLPVSAFHRKVMALIAAGLFLDAFDIYVGGSVLGTLVKEGWSTLQLNAWFITMTFAGLVIGAWGAGIIGDWLGRRASYQVNLAIFGLASLAAAFAPNMIWLIWLRFIMGIGLGAELVVGYATLAEFVPPRQRGRLIAILAAIVNSSVFVAALLSLWIIPHFGWRAMFALVGVASVFVWLARKSMPESPRWLESKGYLQEAEIIVAAMETSAARAGPVPPVPRSAQAVEQRQGLADLFGPQLRHTIVGSTIMAVIGIAIYGFIGWLPTFFVKQGHGIVTSLIWSTIMSLGGPTGGLIGLAIVDRLGRKPILVGFAVFAAVIGSVYQSLSNDTALLVVGFLLVSAIYTIVVVGQAVYLPELFPTAIRMRGAGVCNTAGRLTSAVIQFLVVAIFNLGGLPGVLSFVVAALLLLALVVGTLGRETSKLPLEAIQGRV